MLSAESQRHEPRYLGGDVYDCVRTEDGELEYTGSEPGSSGLAIVVRLNLC
jgi:hypothetical protein